MAAESTILHRTPRAAHSNEAAVWERVWAHCPEEAKDDLLLDRERQGPRWALITDHLERTFGRLDAIKTVELGSGRGDLSVLLAERGADVTLVDRSVTVLTLARSRFDRLGLPARFEQGDLLGNLTRWSRRFDVALSSGVIEHFKGGDRTQAVAAHAEVLRPGGLAVISVPHAWCPSYRIWKAWLQCRGWWPYGLEKPYGQREMRRRAGAAGLDDACTYCMGFHQSVGDHLLKPFLGLRRDWSRRRSWLDASFGATLVLMAQKPGTWRQDSPTSSNPAQARLPMDPAFVAEHRDTLWH